MSDPEQPQTGDLVRAGDRTLAVSGGGLAARALALATDLLVRPVVPPQPGEVRCFRGHRDCVMSVALSPDGRFALSASWDQTWRIWEVDTGREVLRNEGHGHRVSSAVFSHDGLTVLSAGWDGTVRAWERETGAETARFGAPGDGIVHCAALSPDGRTVAWGGGDPYVVLCDLATGEEFRRCEVPVGPVRALRFSPDGRLLLSGSGQVALTAGGRDNGTVCLWDPYSGDRLWGIADATEPVLSVAFSPDGATAFASTGWPSRGRLNITRLWEVESGRLLHRYEAHRHPVFSGSILPAGHNLLLAGRDRLLRIWDPQTEEEVHRLEGHTDAVYAAAVSPDGRFALSGGSDQTIRLWRLPDTPRAARTR